MIYKASEIVAEAKRKNQTAGFKEVENTNHKLEYNRYGVILFVLQNTTLTYIPFSYENLEHAIKTIIEECKIRSEKFAGPGIKDIMLSKTFCAIILMRLIVKTYGTEEQKKRLLEKPFVDHPLTLLKYIRICKFEKPTDDQITCANLVKLFDVPDMRDGNVTVDVDLAYLAISIIEENLEHSGKLL